MLNYSSMSKVFDIEESMLKEHQIQLKVEHYFSDGICARALHIPKGTLLTGRIHKFNNLNILSLGSMLVIGDHENVHALAGAHICSKVGTKRIALALEDCIWTTLIPTKETDVKVIENMFTTNDEKEYCFEKGIIDMNLNEIVHLKKVG